MKKTKIERESADNFLSLSLSSLVFNDVNDN